MSYTEIVCLGDNSSNFWDKPHYGCSPIHQALSIWPSIDGIQPSIDGIQRGGDHSLILLFMCDQKNAFGIKNGISLVLGSIHDVHIWYKIFLFTSIRTNSNAFRHIFFLIYESDSNDDKYCMQYIRVYIYRKVMMTEII